MDVRGQPLHAQQWCGPKQTRQAETWPDVALADTPTDHPIRQTALALAMGGHTRLGDKSQLRLIDNELIHWIMISSLQHPLVVPDEYRQASRPVHRMHNIDGFLILRGRVHGKRTIIF
jgi:hypothetical protein